MRQGFNAINPLGPHGIAIPITRHRFQGFALLSENVTAGWASVVML